MAHRLPIEYAFLIDPRHRFKYANSIKKDVFTFVILSVSVIGLLPSQQNYHRLCVGDSNWFYQVCRGDIHHPPSEQYCLFSQIFIIYFDTIYWNNYLNLHILGWYCNTNFLFLFRGCSDQNSNAHKDCGFINSKRGLNSVSVQKIVFLNDLHSESEE